MLNQILRLVALEQADNDNSQNILSNSALTELPKVIQITISKIGELHKMLSQPLLSTKLTNQRGDTIEAFGFHRLVILQCLDSLVQLNFSSVLIELLQHHDFFIFILHLFFSFPTNNFCHKFVERIYERTITSLNYAPLLDFLDKTNIISIMIKKEEEVEGQKAPPHYLPFLQNIGLLLQEKSFSSDELYNHLIKVEGWEAYAQKVRTLRQSIEPRNPYEVDDSTSDGYDSAISVSQEEEEEEISDEPNDADDYDTDQAEILLSKEEIEAIG